MIDEDRTMQLYGYTSNMLSKESRKLIIRVCEGCGRYDEIIFQSYKYAKSISLCRSCSHKGRSSPMKGKKHSKETKDKIGKSGKGRVVSDKTRKKIGKSRKGIKHTDKAKQLIKENSIKQWNNKENRIKMACIKQGINREDFTGFVGRHPENRSYVKHEKNCIKLNERFKGSHFHHIISGVGIYLPINIHRSIWHSLKNNKNMNEINGIALDYLTTNNYQ